MDGHLEPFSQLEVEVSGFHTWGLFWEISVRREALPDRSTVVEGRLRRLFQKPHRQR